MSATPHGSDSETSRHQGATHDPRAFESVPTEALFAEIERRKQQHLVQLEIERKVLAGRLADFDRQIAALRRQLRVEDKPAGRAAKPARSRRKRHKTNAQPLASVLASLVEVGETISAKEGAARALANGHRSGSKALNEQVAAVLGKDERFKRVGWGKYERVK